MLAFKLTTKVAKTAPFRGSVQTTYQRIVGKLGQPNPRSGNRMTVEWCLEFTDGTIATIYDWNEEATPQAIYNWHIGGNSLEAVEHVKDLLGY
jgi:hypothetical protein